MDEDLKKELAKASAEAQNRYRNIDFQVDTLAVDHALNGYFTGSKNSITINYLEDNENFNKPGKSKVVLIHEQKHRDNQNQGMLEYALSVEHAYKVDMHNEISANMASLIYLRDEYLKTGDISVFDEYDKRFSFYTDAIKNGEINPFSNSKEDFDKEMSLIANGTRDMWVSEFGRDLYIKQNSNSALYYGETDGKHAEFYDENYERAKKIAYNIGGIDFTQYLDKDVEIPEQGKIKILSGEKLAEALELPRYDGSMSLLQYQKLLQHALVMKDGKVGINSDEPFIEGSDLTKGRFNLDMGAFSYLTENKLQDRTVKKYKEALDSIAKEDKKIIEDIIIGIAKDYESRSEKLPVGDDKAYNEAVDRLYSGNVKFNQDELVYEGNVNLRNMFNPSDELPLKELPEKALESQKKLEDMGMWGRGVRQYCDFFGINDRNYDAFADLPFGLRYPVDVLVFGIGAPVVAAGKKCVEFGGDCVDTVKGWFGVEVDKNEPVRPVKEDNTPEYYEWSEEKRVSPIQQKEILNLMADVIEKPTNQGKPDGFLAHRPKKINQEQRKVLKKDMQKEAKDKAKMLKIIERMNKISGVRKEIDAGKTINILYDKYGDNAYDLLIKAVNEPFNYAKDVGDKSIRTSREAVNSLCNLDETKKNVVLNSLLQNKGRY